MEEVGGGMLLWSSDPQAGTGDTGLENINIRNNTIEINLDDWNDSSVSFIAAGIATHGSNTPLPIRTMSITGNEITFVNFTQTAQDLTFKRDSLTAGIVSRWHTGQQGDVATLLENVSITNNIILNALSSGIWTNSDLSEVEISNNTIVNPGRNSDLSKSYSGNQVAWDDDFRAGVYIASTSVGGVASTTADVLVSGNDVEDNSRPTLLEWGVVAVSDCDGNCQAVNNTTDPTSVPELKAGPGWNS